MIRIRSCYLGLGLLWLSAFAPIANGFPSANEPSDIPSELIPTDPEIRQLLQDAKDSRDRGDVANETTKQAEAYEIAQRRNNTGDSALAETALASGLVDKGRLDDAFAHLHHALRLATDSHNLVLEADVLTTLSVEEQLRGDAQAALGTLEKALTRASNSQSLYIKSRVQGERSRLYLLQGSVQEARKAVEQALEIDRTNGYHFYALHLVYRGNVDLAVGDLQQAAKDFNEANAVAYEKKELFAFVQSIDGLSAVLRRQGDNEKALQQLEKLQALDTGVLKSELTIQVQSYLAIPINKIAFLEALGTTYQAVKRPLDALNTWNELETLAKTISSPSLEAEAFQHIAKAEEELGDDDEAEQSYEKAATIYRDSSNSSLLVQALISEASLSLRKKRTNKAISIEEELETIAIRLKLTGLQANAYGVLAEIYVPLGDDGKALEVLLKAIALTRPDPLTSGVNASAIIEDYTLLAAIYKKREKPIEELVSLEMAVGVALKAGDSSTTGKLIPAIKTRFDEIKIHERAATALDEGNLTEALYLSEIIFVYEGVPKPDGDAANWNRVLNIPVQLSSKPEGIDVLSGLLDNMGWILGIASPPVFDALSRHYLFSNIHPELIERFSTETESMLKDTKAFGYRADAVCMLSVAYARQSKPDLAAAKESDCLSLAKESKDKSTLDFANVSLVFSHIAMNNLNSAGDALRYLTTNSPSNPGLHRALAGAYASKSELDAANSELNTAIQEYFAAGDKVNAAKTYVEVSGTLHSIMLEGAKAQELRYLTSAVDLYGELGDRSGQISTLIAIGECYAAESKAKEAVEHFRKAHDLATSSSLPEFVGLSLLDLGAAYQKSGDQKSAVDAYRKASVAYHQTSLRSMESLALLRLSELFLQAHNPTLALSTALDAKRLASTTSATFCKYYASFLIGEVLSAMGQFEKALDAYHEAESVTKEASDWEHLAYSEMAIGQCNELLGYWEEARQNAESARETFKKINNLQGESIAVAMLVSIYSDRTSSIKNFEKASKYYSEAQQLGYGERLELDLVESYLASGRFAEAIAATKTGIKDCLKTKDVACEAHGLISISEAERRAGNLKSAGDDLKKAEPLVRDSKDFYLHGRLLYGKASQLRAEKRFGEALSAYLEVISLIEGLKSQGDSKTQQNISEAYGFIYDELTSDLYSLASQSPGADKLKFASSALEYAETNKARQFLNSWGRTFVTETRRTLPVSVRDKEDSLAQKEIDIESNSDGSTENVRNTNLRSLREDKHQFVTTLRTSYPQYATLAYPQPIAISTLPLKQYETLVEFKVTEDSTFVWIIRADRQAGNRLLAFYQVPRSRKWLDDKTSALRKALNSAQVDGIDWSIAEDLFRALFPPDVTKDLLQSTSVTFIPDDVLSVLPLEILSPQATKGIFPLLSIPTRYYPSAASLELSRVPKPTFTWEKAFLGIADPITSPNDERYAIAKELSPNRKVNTDQDDESSRSAAVTKHEKIAARGFSLDRIPGTSKEVQDIAALFQSENESTETRFGADATKEMLSNTDLSRFRFLHFATHGILPVDMGIKEPSLVLSYDGTSVDDMFLSMSEILALRVHAEAVVLSACNTGSGAVSHAEGVMSLGRAFLASGASSVAVSLWQVSDESTAILMQEFYRNLLAGKGKDVALANARVALFNKGFKEPYFWAPFIVIGE